MEGIAWKCHHADHARRMLVVEFTELRLHVTHYSTDSCTMQYVRRRLVFIAVRNNTIFSNALPLRVVVLDHI